MKRITITGNLARDPERSTTKAGADRTVFTVAVARGREKEPLWFRVTALGVLAKNAASWLSKGRHVTVEGDFDFNTFDKKDGTKGSSLEILATDIDYGTRMAESSAPVEQKQEPAVDCFELSTEDIPF